MTPDKWCRQLGTRPGSHLEKKKKKKKKKAWGENTFKNRVAQSTTGNLGGDFTCEDQVKKQAGRGHPGSSYAIIDQVMMTRKKLWRTLETKISLITPIMIWMSFHLEGSTENCRLVDEAFFIPDFAETLLIINWFIKTGSVAFNVNVLATWNQFKLSTWMGLSISWTIQVLAGDDHLPKTWSFLGRAGHETKGDLGTRLHHFRHILLNDPREMPLSVVKCMLLISICSVVFLRCAGAL